jgi:hypothetical protein
MLVLGAAIVRFAKKFLGTFKTNKKFVLSALENCSNNSLFPVSGAE